MVLAGTVSATGNASPDAASKAMAISDGRLGDEGALSPLSRPALRVHRCIIVIALADLPLTRMTSATTRAKGIPCPGARPAQKKSAPLGPSP